jgi:hypothetical protein
MKMNRDKEEKELASLSNLTFDFANVMRAKLWKKYEEGKRGDDTPDELRRLLANCILKYNAGEDPAQLVDIGNLAALLWRLEAKK